MVAIKVDEVIKLDGYQIPKKRKFWQIVEEKEKSTVFWIETKSGAMYKLDIFKGTESHAMILSLPESEESQFEDKYPPAPAGSKTNEE